MEKPRFISYGAGLFLFVTVGRLFSDGGQEDAVDLAGGYLGRDGPMLFRPAVAVHRFEPVVVGDACCGGFIHEPVAGAHRAAGGDLAGDQGRVELNPGSLWRIAAVEVKAEGVDLAGCLPVKLDLAVHHPGACDSRVLRATHQASPRGPQLLDCADAGAKRENMSLMGRKQPLRSN